MKKGTIFTLIFVILLAAGWYLLKHYTGLLSKNYTYYGYYENAKGLQPSSGVYLKGVKIGKVSEIDLSGNRIVVTFLIRKEQQLPEGTIAVIAPGDMLGGKAVNFEPGKGPGFLNPGAVLPTATDTTFVENFDAKITPIMEDAKFMLRTTDSGLNVLRYVLSGGWGGRTRQDIENLQKTSQTLAKSAISINGKSTQITNGINNLDSSLADPTHKNADINKSISTSLDKTAKMANTPVQQQVEDLGKSLNSLSNTIEQINKGNNALGKMLTDKKDYRQLKTSLDTLNTSMKELQKDPPGISIFGKKKKKK